MHFPLFACKSLWLFFFLNTEELWGFQILLKTSHFGFLFVWLVVFWSSGARHLQSLCPTSASSETSHPSWHYLGFCPISHLLLSTQQLIPLHPFVSSVLPRRHMRGPFSGSLAPCFGGDFPRGKQTHLESEPETGTPSGSLQNSVSGWNSAGSFNCFFQHLLCPLEIKQLCQEPSVFFLYFRDSTVLILQK